jgi:hypothetical protein
MRTATYTTSDAPCGGCSSRVISPRCPALRARRHARRPAAARPGPRARYLFPHVTCSRSPPLPPRAAQWARGAGAEVFHAPSPIAAVLDCVEPATRILTTVTWTGTEPRCSSGGNGPLRVIHKIINQKMIKLRPLELRAGSIDGLCRSSDTTDNALTSIFVRRTGPRKSARLSMSASRPHFSAHGGRTRRDPAGRGPSQGLSLP